MNVELSFRNSDLNSNSPPRINISPIFTCVFMFGHTENLSWPLFNSLKVQFFHPLSTNLLYWAHWAHTLTLLGLGYKLWPYNWRRLWEELVLQCSIMVIAGSGPHQTSPHQAESVNVREQDEFLNLEREKDLENYQEGSLHTVHTGGSGFRRKGHAIHEHGDEKAMQ